MLPALHSQKRQVPSGDNTRYEDKEAVADALGVPSGTVVKLS